MQLRELKDKAVAEHPELPTSTVVDCLVGKFRGVGTVYVPSEIAELSTISDVGLILKTLDLLSKQPYAVLECQWIYIDDDNTIFELAYDEVAETFASGTFHHPKTGDPVPGYQDAIRLLYEATPTFDSMLTGSEKKKDSIRPDQATPLSKITEILGRDFRLIPRIQYAMNFLRDLVALGVPALERSAKNHRKSHEDALTDTLVAPLLVPYPHISREADSAGHVDIVVQQPFENRAALLGEAKVIDHRGFSWYEKGITTLVQKYNRGNDQVVLMVGYCRKPDIVSTALDFMQQIESNRVAGFIGHESSTRYQIDPTRNSQIFITKHQTTGNPIDVFHILVNLHAPADNAS